MGSVCRRTSELDLLWRLRFGEPPPVRASPALTRRILEAYAETPAPRLCAEAAVLERDGEQACEALRDVRARSRALVQEARRLAGLQA